MATIFNDSHPMIPDTLLPLMEQINQGILQELFNLTKGLAEYLGMNKVQTFGDLDYSLEAKPFNEGLALILRDFSGGWIAQIEIEDEPSGMQYLRVYSQNVKDPRAEILKWNEDAFMENTGHDIFISAYKFQDEDWNALPWNMQVPLKHPLRAHLFYALEEMKSR